MSDTQLTQGSATVGDSVDGGARTRQLILLGAVAAMGAAVGALLMSEFRTFSGDEPPIRVKNGSIDLELLSAGAWVDEAPGDPGKKWRIDRGTRGKPELRVIVAAKSGPCSERIITTKKLTISYASTGREVKFHLQGTGNNTRVEAENMTFTQATDGRLVSTDAPYVSKLTWGAGHGESCSFNDRDELVALYILDW